MEIPNGYIPFSFDDDDGWMDNGSLVAGALTFASVLSIITIYLYLSINKPFPITGGSILI